MKKNFIITICVLSITCCFSQGSKIDSINIQNYNEYGIKYIQKKIDEINSLPKDIVSKYHEDLILCNYDVNELEIYSCPIFDLDTKGKIENDLVEYISFKTDVQKQILKIYKDSLLVSEHTLNNSFKETFNEQIDEFEFYNNAVLEYKEEPLYGLPIEDQNNFSSLINFEKTDLLFQIYGVNDYFIYRDGKVFAIKFINRKKGLLKKSFDKYLQELEISLVDINEYKVNVNSLNFYDDTIKDFFLSY